MTQNPRNTQKTNEKSLAGHRPNQRLISHLQRQSGLVLVIFCVFLSALSIMAAPQELITAATAPPQQESAYYYIGCYTARTDLLKETIYAKTPQACIEICEHQVNNYAVLFGERCFCANNANEAERQDEQLCNTRCMANKAQYCGGVGVHSYYATMLTKEPAPSQLRILNATENTLSLSWRAFEPRKRFVAEAEAPAATQQQQQITNFLIRSHVVHTYSSLPFFAQPEFIVQASETHFEMTDLHPATTYNVSVAAMCGELVCGSATLIGQTVVGQPSPAPEQPRVLVRTDATITVELAPIRNDNGPVSQVLVIVERVDAALSQPFDTTLLGSWEEAQQDGLPYYIAAALDYQPEDENRTRKFTIGDGKRYGRYTNPPINEETGDAKNLETAHIHVSLGVVSSLNGVTKTIYTRSTHDQHAKPPFSMDNFSYANFDTGRESVIALVVICIIFGTCLVLSILAYFYLRFKTAQTRNNGANRRDRCDTHEMTLQQPIIERENNGFVVEDEAPPTAENFKQQLNEILARLDASQRLPRNVLRMNVNDVIAEGRYGEVITGKLVSAAAADIDCQLHVLSLDDLTSSYQAQLLQEFRQLTRLQRHDHLLDFYGVSASADWFYFVFEQQSISLKRRLIESRRAPNTAPMQRITALSEELVLQWIYEIVSALAYLSSCKTVHKQLSAHSIFVTADSRLKVAALFGPVPFVHNQKKIDLTRWLAPEVLRYQHFSAKSDVWSFACVAWECCSLGGTPYAHINDQTQVLEAIKGGARPAQPAYVFEDLYQLLLNCWQLEPSERISFDDIALSVRQLMTSPRHALCFDRLPETPGNNVVDTLPYYLPMLEMHN